MNTHINNLPPRVILWGGTGQAKVVRPIIEHYGSNVVAVFDDTLNLPAPFADIPLYHGWVDFQKWIVGQRRNELGFCIAIGNPHGHIRVKLHEQLIKEGLTPITIAHPSAQIADDAIIEPGCQFMAGAIVNPQAKLGRQCIINTKASVDHECILGDGVEVGPGATLCGLINIDANTWICAGVTILPRLNIGSNVIVGAGSLVIRDVPSNVTIVGVPANRIIRKSEE